MQRYHEEQSARSKGARLSPLDSRGRSRHLLEIAFSEPLLRTLLRTLCYLKPTAGPLLRTLLRTPSPEPFPEPFSEPF